MNTDELSNEMSIEEYTKTLNEALNNAENVTPINNIALNK